MRTLCIASIITLYAQQRLTITPSALTLRPNQTATLSISPSFTHVEASPPLARLDTSTPGSLLIQAPSQSGYITLTIHDNNQSVVVPIQVIAQNWDARAIIGLHQTGASSAQSTQRYFFDFYVTRPLGSGPRPFDNRLNLWGDVRIASAPQQLDIPIAQFAPNFAAQIGSVAVNKLALAAEFVTGFELRARKFITPDTTRTLGAVAFFGATGSLSDPASQARIFKLPAVATPQFSAAAARFPLTQNALYIGLIPQDRERFYRQYGFGIRYTAYTVSAPPEMLTITVGQDQSVTAGRYHGPVLRIDALYPLPLKRYCLYLVAAANFAVAKVGSNTSPLALELAPTIPIHDPRVALFSVASARDTYKIGIGIDFLSLFPGRR